MLVLLIILLVLLAITGGGIFPASLSAAAACLCAAALYMSVRNGRRMSNSMLPCAVVGLIALLAVTAIPLPSQLAGLLSSERVVQNSAAEAAIAESAELGLIDESSPSFSISRNRSGTLRIVLLLICIFACAALTSQLEQKQKLRFISFTLVLGVIIAIGGFMTQWILPQGKSIWWTFKVNHGHPVGCFINRNHFGGYLAMLSPAAFILSASYCERRKWLKASLCAFAFSVISFAAISSLSRGAWLAWSFAMLATAVLLTHKAKTRRIITALGCIIAIACVAALGLTSRDDVTERLSSFENITETASADMRITTWKDALKIIPDYPLLGTGANGFRMIFPQYRTSSSRKEFKHVENDYIQFVVESGIAGSLLLVAILVLAFLRWRAERDPDSSGEHTITACVIGALIAVAVHALLDFAIRVPLYSITLAALIGLAIKPDSNGNKPTQEEGPPAYIHYLAGLGLIAAICFGGGYSSTQLDSSDRIESASAAELCRSLTYSPTSWQVWYHLGNKAITSGQPEAYDFGERCITQAVRYDPLNYRLLKQLCLVRLHQNDIEGAKEAYKDLKALRTWVKIHELE